MFTLEHVSGSITGVQLPSSGDWEIIAPTVVTDETINFQGNIIVSSSLTLINTTLIIECDYDGQYGIDVLSGGDLIMEDHNGYASNVTAANQYAYTFKIRSGAEAEFSNSEIHRCGFATDPISDSSGLYIESSNVVIQGCTLSDNYIGLLFNSSNSIDGYFSSENISYVNYVSYNIYGLYAMYSTTIECSNMVVTENEIYDVYTASNANVEMSNCYEVSKSGGSGQLTQIGWDGCINPADYFEIDYNPNAKTFRYEGWHCWQNGQDVYYYANSYCVLRRNHDYSIEENIKLSVYAIGDSSSPTSADGLSGWSYYISYPTAPSDATNLLKNQGGVKSISIPSCYPVLYCTIVMYQIFNYHGMILDTAWLQSIVVYIIFDVPTVYGTDPDTGIGTEGICEYLYENDDGTATNLSDNIDLAGPFWWGSGSSSTLYKYGGDSITSGINYNLQAVYRLGCAAAYNCQLGFNAADKIKNFVNYLVFGNWVDQNNSAYTRPVNKSLEYVTINMARDPANNIVHDLPLSNPDTSNHDALGLHGACASEHGTYPSNNWDYNCHDFAAISTALDRSIGLASRQVTGYFYNDTNISYSYTYHVWTEVWIPNGQAANGSYDDQWCVFDACGNNFSGGVIDNDTKVYPGNTRNGYLNGASAKFGRPYKVYCYFATSTSQITKYELTYYYWNP
jgi:hypothetical protein